MHDYWFSIMKGITFLIKKVGDLQSEEPIVMYAIVGLSILFIAMYAN